MGWEWGRRLHVALPLLCADMGDIPDTGLKVEGNSSLLRTERWYMQRANAVNLLHTCIYIYMSHATPPISLYIC
ncbi:hypothetical protein XELAEV_18023100mg [Xenopus laevis]|uniref:Uncharacterized protein n=1 Tax=Xenopus laevis TaxID=8355 RepID=A0A974D5E5_XENLA|nr:hypothetical protein XELAEV_18023100mg [Xenopus laevis]